LLVFEYFSLIRRPATASEIEEALDIPQSSASVLLRCLAELGYLEYVPAGRRYRPTARVAIFSDWLKPTVSENLLTARLDQLRDRTHETVLVGRRHRHYVDFVHIVQSHQQVQFYMRDGAKRHLCLSSSGRMLMTLQSPAANRRVVRCFNAEAGRGPHIDEAYLLSSVAKARENGFAETETSMDGGSDFHGIAMLMPRGAEGEQYTVCVAGPRERVLRRREDILVAIREWIADSSYRERARVTTAAGFASVEQAS
jgi:DNA-binding IclR family transcriptional regulator